MHLSIYSSVYQLNCVFVYPSVRCLSQSVPLQSVYLSVSPSVRHYQIHIFNPCFKRFIKKIIFLVPFTETPKYNPRRRASTAPILRTLSDCGSVQYDTLRRIESPLTGYMMKPSSPSLSDRSMPPFSSGSSVSETSTG